MEILFYLGSIKRVVITSENHFLIYSDNSALLYTGQVGRTGRSALFSALNSLPIALESSPGRVMHFAYVHGNNAQRNTLDDSKIDSTHNIKHSVFVLRHGNRHQIQVFAFGLHRLRAANIDNSMIALIQRSKPRFTDTTTTIIANRARSMLVRINW